MANPDHRSALEASVKMVIGTEGEWVRLDERGSVRMRVAVSRRIILIAVVGRFLGLPVIVIVTITVAIIIAVIVTVSVRRPVKVGTAMIRPVMSVRVVPIVAIRSVEGIVMAVAAVVRKRRIGMTVTVAAEVAVMMMGSVLRSFLARFTAFVRMMMMMMMVIPVSIGPETVEACVGLR